MKQKTKFKQTEIGKIPEDWEVKPLSDISIEIIDGDRGKNYPNGSDFSDNGYCLFLNTKNVPGTKFDFKECMFIKKEKDDILRKGKLKRGDIVVTTRGTVGNIAHYNKDVPYDNIRINSGMVILRNLKKDFYTEFLLQELGSNIIKNQISSSFSGSAQPQLPIRDMKQLFFLIPSFPEQSAIAKILSDLDSKIELNQQMNQTLESIGQTIFKHWFVDFEFPDEQGKPYKSSGGEMIDSKLGKIPKGWEIVPLKDIASKEKNSIVDGPFGTQMKIAEYQEKGVPVIEMGFLEGFPFYKPFSKFISEEKYETVKRSTVKAGDIVISKTGTLGLLGIMTEEWDKAIIVSRLAKITPDTNIISRYYLFYIFKRLSEEKYWDRISSGSTMPIFNLTHIKSKRILLPSKEIQNKFEEIARIHYNKILINLKENWNLSRIRDTLLPKLMSGQIRVLVS